MSLYGHEGQGAFVKQKPRALVPDCGRFRGGAVGVEPALQEGESGIKEWRETGLLAEGTVFRAEETHNLAARFKEVMEWMGEGNLRDADRAAQALEGMLPDYLRSRRRQAFLLIRLGLLVLLQIPVAF
ncbi:hypothetical protein [Paenibacillus durus]|nr:hypothetical protein [Paenibacillus durus]